MVVGSECDHLRSRIAASEARIDEMIDERAALNPRIDGRKINCISADLAVLEGELAGSRQRAAELGRPP